MIDAHAPVEWFEEIDSTLLEARRRTERKEYGPVWLLARRQSAGRGRRGRVWVSIEGNLFATYLFETSRPAAEAAQLGFAAGLAIAETFEAFGARSPARLKWPNDVMLGASKAAGILLESGAASPGKLWVALAFGVNIAAAPGAIDQPTTCLRAALPEGALAPSPAAFFGGLRPCLEGWCARLAEEGFEPLRAAWLARAYGIGQPARVLQGETQLEGALAGLTARGELELDTPSGRRVVAAGDVFFSSAA